MPRKIVVTKRPTYREGVEWIALNDNNGQDDPRACTTDDARMTCMENIAGYISTLLLADLFGADPANVAADIYRMRMRVRA